MGIPRTQPICTCYSKTTAKNRKVTGKKAIAVRDRTTFVCACFSAGFTEVALSCHSLAPTTNSHQSWCSGDTKAGPFCLGKKPKPRRASLQEKKKTPPPESPSPRAPIRELWADGSIRGSPRLLGLRQGAVQLLAASDPPPEPARQTPDARDARGKKKEKKRGGQNLAAVDRPLCKKWTTFGGV